jgi:hypothetical protein
MISSGSELLTGFSYVIENRGHAIVIGGTKLWLGVPHNGLEIAQGASGSAISPDSHVVTNATVASQDSIAGIFG